MAGPITKATASHVSAIKIKYDVESDIKKIPNGIENILRKIRLKETYTTKSITKRIAIG